MADEKFSCEPGKVLTRAETEAMLDYDEAGVPRPDAYRDVVFDATSPQGSVYRCKTQAELDREAEVLKADADRTQRRAENVSRIRQEHRESMAAELGVDAASLPVDLGPGRMMVNDAGTSGGDATDTGDTTTGGTTGGGRGSRTKAD